MKKFLFKVLLPVVIIVVSVLIGGEYYLRSLPNDFKEKRQYLENNASSLKLIVLGASSASMGIKPSYFDIQPAYNFAYASQSLNYDYWILNYSFERMDSLKWVILDMGFARPWSPKSTIVPNYNKYYQIYWGYPNAYNGDIFSYFEVLAGSSTIYHKINAKEKKLALQTIDSDGYQSGYYEESPIEKEKWEKAVLWNLEHHSVLSDEDAAQRYRDGVSYYCQIIELCNKKNVKVALVTVPTLSMFYEKFDTCQINIVRHLADSLSSVYPNVYYWDYLKADSLFTVDEMYNPTHLNSKGAKKFTSLLNEKIKETGISRKDFNN